MVGISGRSRGCETCRKRHIKCDELHPVCRRCQAGGFVCTGYRGLTFIDEASKIRRKAQSTKSAAIDRKCSERLNNISSHPKIYIPLDQASYPVETCLSFVRSLRKSKASAFQAPVVKSIHTRKVRQSYRLSRQTFIALSVTFFGLHKNDPGTVQNGLNLYGQAMETLKESLQDPVKRKLTDTAFSTIALGTLESILPGTQSSFMSHLEGLEQLLQIHRPRRFCKLPDRLITDRLRPLLIFVSLDRYKPSRFRSPEWSTAPWFDLIGRERIDLEPLNLLGEIPEIFALRRELLTNGSSTTRSQELFGQISRHAVCILQRLVRWRRVWSISRPDSGICCTKLPQGQSEVMLGDFPPLRSSDLQTVGASDVNGIMLYDTIVIILVGVLRELVSLHDQCANSTTSNFHPSMLSINGSQIPAKDYPGYIRTAAHELIQQINYVTSAGIAECGPFYLCIYARLACRVCGAAITDESAQLSSLLKQAEKAGFIRSEHGGKWIEELPGIVCGASPISSNFAAEQGNEQYINNDLAKPLEGTMTTPGAPLTPSQLAILRDRMFGLQDLTRIPLGLRLAARVDADLHGDEVGAESFQ